MGNSNRQSDRRRPRGLVLLVAFGIILPGAILGALNLSSLEGDRLARERIHEEKHRRIADEFAVRLVEALEERVGEVESLTSSLRLEDPEGVIAFSAELEGIQEQVPEVSHFFLVAPSSWELLVPAGADSSAIAWSETDLRRGLDRALMEKDRGRRAEALLDLYGRALALEGGHLGSLLRREIGQSLESLLESGRLQEWADRFLELDFRNRYTDEICDQLRSTQVESEFSPARWDTAASMGSPILYGILPVAGHEPRYLLGFVFDLDWLKEDLLPRILASTGEEGLRVGVTDLEGNRLTGTSAGDFVPATLSLGMGLPRWTVEVGGDREAFERSHRTRRGILLGLITVLAIAIFAGAGWTIRGVTREMEASRQKSEFVASVSHELRTPLTSIRIFADMIRSGRAPSPEKKIEYARLIARESERLGRLINNVLDFSRLEEGKVRFEKAAVPLGELVHRAVEDFREQLLEEGYPLETQIDEDLPTLPMDQEALSRAIYNLLANAVKYSGRDKRIIVRASRRGSEARISVQDHGPGIPESEQKHIFEKFYRAKDVGPSGCGLGLAIVRAILNGHGGRAEVTSRVGEGSTFTLILPVAPPGAPKDTRTDSGTPARNV